MSVWKRYIDDIVFLWNGSREECDRFIALLNNNNINIRLTASLLATQVEFLNLLLTVRDDKLVTSLFL